VYAIVRSGGRQEKVAVGDVFELDRVAGEPGSTIQLPALLLVDGDQVTTDAEYKNKTGYKKRQGHRQRLTQVQITGIETTGSTAAAE
jgi:large subunit ribosomal protein L21